MKIWIKCDECKEMLCIDTIELTFDHMVIHCNKCDTYFNFNIIDLIEKGNRRLLKINFKCERVSKKELFDNTLIDNISYNDRKIKIIEA